MYYLQYTPRIDRSGKESQIPGWLLQCMILSTKPLSCTLALARKRLKSAIIFPTGLRAFQPPEGLGLEPSSGKGCLEAVQGYGATNSIVDAGGGEDQSREPMAVVGFQ
jgi:hypothetical protein